MKILGFLQGSIHDTMCLSEMIDIFKEMYGMSLEIDVDDDDDIILFETGVYTITEKPQFWFSLVRQFSNGDGEYFQLHMDVFFSPNEKNSHISCTEWSDCIDGDFFDFVKLSDAYLAVKDERPVEVRIYLDET